MPKLRKDYREHLPIIGDLLEDMETKLDSRVFDNAEPSLEPALGEARKAIGRARAFVGELDWLAETEHGSIEHGS